DGGLDRRTDRSGQQRPADTIAALTARGSDLRAATSAAPSTRASGDRPLQRRTGDPDRRYRRTRSPHRRRGPAATRRQQRADGAAGGPVTCALVARLTPPCGSEPPAAGPLRPLDQQRHTLADADAQRGQAAAGVLSFQPAQQRDDQARSGAAQRMAEGDRSTVGVDLLLVELEAPDDREALRGERLV